MHAVHRSISKSKLFRLSKPHRAIPFTRFTDKSNTKKIEDTPPWKNNRDRSPRVHRSNDSPIGPGLARREEDIDYEPTLSDGGRDVNCDVKKSYLSDNILDRGLFANVRPLSPFKSTCLDANEMGSNVLINYFLHAMEIER